MHEVTVDRHQLLTKLQANRESHKKAFQEAMDGYKEQLRNAFLSKIAELNAGGVPDTNTGLPRPSDHTQDYDHIISMVEMSVEDELKLSSQEFAMYVMDNWSWKQSFTATASNYR